ncbi:MAG: isocitrate/isopropylmalate dehydrogenase family protein [Elusimicrobia bacterium]|nr:isocitrate/isopropylmalate dehydrogenase family protein [Elusimicrobiota bacterium]MBU2614694.1 isocitrate/isopropylmalate dehydrogenase family protein [Elusimicrobiota bacterium]
MQKTYNITLIPGDGTGPELSETVQRVLEATGVKIEWDVVIAGQTALEKFGTPLPDNVLTSIKKNKVALKGPLTTPIGTGFRSVNVALRQLLNLYACVRPCKSYKGVKSRYENLDIVLVRENTEDLYAGIEFAAGSPEAKEIIKMSKGKARDDSAISIKPISRTGSEQILRFAFDYAVKNKRKKVTAVAKANIMKITDGLFFNVAKEIAKEYPSIQYDEKLVDNMCMQLVQKPEIYDVLALPNLYGDILSDLCAGLVGGLGVAPGANFGPGLALFEAVHGSAPKYTGLNKVNPTALLLSAKLMLEYIGEAEKAVKLEKAIVEVIADGKRVTYDMGGSSTTSDMGNAVIEKLK